MSKIRTSLGTFVVVAAMQFAASTGFAVPVSYTFTTGQTSYQGVLSAFPVPQLPVFGGVSGTFSWDSAGSFVQFNPDGSSAYAGFTPPSITGLTPSISGLSATFLSSPGQHDFSDPNGSTSVWNDNATNFFGSGIVGDALILGFDPPAANGNLFPRNLTGGDMVSGSDMSVWHLYSARMLWVEGMVAKTNEFANPNVGAPIGDFLSNQSLPGSLPSFEGRLWLEFQNTANPTQVSFVFYNNLRVEPSIAAIPEPETYAMLLAGLGLLGWRVRRGKESRQRSNLEDVCRTSC